MAEYLPRNEREQFIMDMVKVACPNVSVKSVKAFHGDWYAMGKSINPNKNIYFGTLSFWLSWWNKYKDIGYFDSAFFGPPPHDLYLTLNNRKEFFLTDAVPNATSQNGACNYFDVLFDDIRILAKNIGTGSNYGDSQPSAAGANRFPWPTELSIAQVIPGSNFAPGAGSFFTAVTAANPFFVYAPDVLFFSGYVISLEG